MKTTTTNTNEARVTAEQVERLARAFALRLRLTLGTAAVRRVWMANVLDGDPSVCHSHDLCDANEVMAAAFAMVAGRAPCEVRAATDEECALWNAAWALAKARRFFL